MTGEQLKDLIWYQRPEARLDTWRSFRQSLDDMELAQVLCETAALWSFAPYVTYYLDPHDVRQWPDPWQLLSENYYCDLAKTLGMLYTIALTKHKTNDLSLQVLYDQHKREQVNIVVVNNKHVINYHFNEVVNKDDIGEHCVVKQRYTPHDLNIEQYY